MHNKSLKHRANLNADTLKQEYDREFNELCKKIVELNEKRNLAIEPIKEVKKKKTKQSHAYQPVILEKEKPVIVEKEYTLDEFHGIINNQYRESRKKIDQKNKVDLKAEYREFLKKLNELKRVV